MAQEGEEKGRQGAVIAFIFPEKLIGRMPVLLWSRWGVLVCFGSVSALRVLDV